MKRIIKYISLLVLPLASFSQPAPVWPVDTILNRIDKNNIGLHAYKLQAESFRHKAEAASGWMAPMVGAGTFMTPYPGEKLMESRDRGSIMFEAEQEIPNPAKQRAKRSFIQSQANEVLSGRGVAFNNLRAQARTSYYDWVIAKNKISVLKRNDKLFETLRKIEEVRYPYNKSLLSGLYTIDARREENNNMIIMQNAIIARAKATLLTLMNEDAATTFDIDSVADAHFVPELVDDTSAIAASRADIGQVNDRIRSMRLNITSMRTESKPDFKIRFDHMTPRTSMMPNAFSVMGMISIPIVPWASRTYKSEIKAMEYSIRSMEKEREGMLVETKGMLRGMQAEIQQMHDRVLSMENKIIPALQKALDANYILYQENKLELNMLLDSWEALNMMHITLLDEKLKHYQMLIEYDKLLYQ